MAIAAAVFIWVAILLSLADVFVGRRRAKRAPQSEKIKSDPSSPALIRPPLTSDCVVHECSMERKS